MLKPIRIGYISGEYTTYQIIDIGRDFTISRRVWTTKEVRDFCIYGVVCTSFIMGFLSSLCIPLCIGLM